MIIDKFNFIFKMFKYKPPSLSDYSGHVDTKDYPITKKQFKVHFGLVCGDITRQDKEMIEQALPMLEERVKMLVQEFVGEVVE